jgi:hypothetical protein
LRRSPEALEWQDESEWELDDRGQPRNPWQETFYMVMRQLDKDGTPYEGEEGLFTFTTASVGGKDAVIDLCAKCGAGHPTPQCRFPRSSK